jgi:ribosomal protein S18 acetylase RimI-like enzyme
MQAAMTALEIEEMKAPGRIDVLDEIIRPFGFTEATRAAIIDNLQSELRELGRNRVFFVGSVDERPTSAVQLLLNHADNDPSLADGLTVAHVHGLWIRKDLQRRGFGFDTMRHAEKAAALRGFRMLTVGVDHDNLAAHALYEKLGFAEFNRKPGRVPDEPLFLLRKEIAR